MNINAISAYNAPKMTSFKGEEAQSSPFNNFVQKEDSVEISSTPKDAPPAEAKENNEKIGFFRLFFKRLTQEQIDKVNETGMLPEKAKFRASLTNSPSGSYFVQNNIFNLTNGTRQLPEGFEVRKNKLGFTRVVPKGTDGFWMKKDK